MIETVQKWIQQDIKSNCTPDLPALRYFGGGIPIFLWDDMKEFSNILEVIGSLDYNDNCEVRHPDARSQLRYIPWYNLDPSQEVYPAYCLEEPEDLDFITVEDYCLDQPLELEGKVLYVSLAALQEFDMYYNNQHLFNRVKIKVYPSKWYKTPIECYTWMNDIDQVTEYDMKTNEYVLMSNLDPVPFRDTGDLTYSF